MFERINRKLLLGVFTILLCTGVLSLSETANSWQGRCLNKGDEFGGMFDDGCDNWIDEMDTMPGYGTLTNDNYIYGSEFCDYNINSGCHDHEYDNIDDGDANVFITHGVVGWNNTWEIKMSNTLYNPGSNDNWATSDVWSVGDNDAEYITSFACDSAPTTRMDDVGDWVDGLHQWHGFHGKSCNLYSRDRIGDFVDDAIDGAISLAWITNMLERDTNCVGPTVDNCPVSIIFGTSESNCNSRRTSEQYDSFYGSDPPEDEVEIYHTYCGCDPDGRGDTC